MPPTHRQIFALPVAAMALLGLSGCAKTVETSSAKTEPFTVEKVDGTELGRLRLEAKAAERLGLKTEKVVESAGAGAGAGAGTPSSTAPYAAVLYDAQGTTFVYTNPEPLVFARQSVTVEHINDGLAVLSEGPPPGTPVVTVGGAELAGIEFGVGK